MFAVWLVTGTAVALFLGVLIALRTEFRAATPGWKLLAVSGTAIALGGVGFAVRFWEPSAGPYVANGNYPLGPYLNTWVVSFGFSWLAFGLLFVGLALHGARHPSRLLWVTLLAAWFLCWLPHGIIGIGFAWAGHNGPSTKFYHDWARSGWAGMLTLSTSSLVLLIHFTSAITGFTVTGRQVWHVRGRRASLLEPLDNG